jgi:hypothetical protein
VKLERVYNGHTLLADSLKVKSPIYPEVIQFKQANEDWLSTLVRIKRGRKWYKVHLMEFSVETPIELTLQRLHLEAYKIIHFYKLCGLEEMDELQISEQERLNKQYNLCQKVD